MENEFCNITGSDEATAVQFLQQYHGSLELAVHAFMEHQDKNSIIISDEEVTINDSINDYAEPSVNNGKFKKCGVKRRLDEIFARPIDLNFSGYTFEEFRRAGNIEARWLLVDVYCSTEFACVCLNRDIWSDKLVRSILQDHFLFWQVPAESPEGQRFVQRYHVKSWPHVCILDPLTGECVTLLKDLCDPASFSNVVSNFLANHGQRPDNGEFQDDGSPPCKRYANGSRSLSELTSRIHISKIEMEKAVPNVLELSEEEQLQLAMEASRACAVNSVTIDSDFEWAEDDEESSSGVSSDHSLQNCNRRRHARRSQVIINNNGADGGCIEDWRQYLGSSDDAPCRLLLRFPRGDKEQLTLPSSSCLKALILYVESKGYPASQYEIVANYPRRELSRLKLMSKLENVQLCPHDTVYIQER